MVAVIDYDAGNIRSVEKALEYLGEKVIITREAGTILSADRIVLPGVGAFGDAMALLERYELPEVIRKAVGDGIPFLGICLGLQLLFEESEESPGVKGLGLLKGKCVRFRESEGMKVPQIGWNGLHFPKESRLFDGIPEETYVYFVHSYCLHAANREAVAAEAVYTETFDAAVEWGNLFACQFHPEKSGRDGIQILSNFLKVK